MSLKEIDNKEHYHYVKHLIDNDEKNDSKTYEDEKDETKKSIWEDLLDMRNQLKNYNVDDIKKYIKDNMQDEVRQINEEFHKQFDDAEDCDELRLEVLLLLDSLGITIYKKRD